MGASPSLANINKTIKIDIIDKINNKLNEGVWKVPSSIVLKEFIKDIEKLKDKYWNKLGSDAVYDALDAAIKEAKQIKSY